MAPMGMFLPREEKIGIDNAPVIHPQDEPFLLSANLLTPVDWRGFRGLHKRRVRHDSNFLFQYLPLRAPASTTLDLFETIPAQRISQATFEYMGFDFSTAMTIWSRWHAWGKMGETRVESYDGRDEDEGIHFVEIATWHIDFYSEISEWDADQVHPDEVWENVFDICGINTQLREESYLLYYQSRRGKENCLQWLKQTMFQKYQHLGRIQEESHRRVFKRERALYEIEGEAPLGYFGAISGTDYQW
ncbi:hypothetical protein CDD81_1602 [Ophiocordyceps australis]|uniref:Uncharacterized protein n=1 Tax=Ophiocordyceps australis TaxID=1399860 RepID=A0A2C5XZW0_9HYPO|nr:hypothetical protein CDD81_1602 [Ophiocordyceps australis]